MVLLPPVAPGLGTACTQGQQELRAHAGGVKWSRAHGFIVGTRLTGGAPTPSMDLHLHLLPCAFMHVFEAGDYNNRLVSLLQAVGCVERRIRRFSAAPTCPGVPH
jgi:hypothetical protein